MIQVKFINIYVHKISILMILHQEMNFELHKKCIFMCWPVDFFDNLLSNRLNGQLCVLLTFIICKSKIKSKIFLQK